MFLSFVLGTWIWTLVVIGILTVAWRFTEAFSRAPMLDVAVSLLTWIPWVWGASRAGWTGLWGTMLGEFLALQTWCIVNAIVYRHRRPTIHATLNRIVGASRNHLGLWLTLPALPMFLGIRAAEIIVYPILVGVVGFPQYKQSDWVNVSRQKFSGMIGHDLIWCLYCDWMTGVYSLGAEMLRNIESFWCPIKFYPGKKCENCRIEFPDIDKWVEPTGTMEDVEKALLKHYPPDSTEPLSWWGHVERKKGKDEE